jgi:TrmH family RNA methyltransferase
LFRNSIETIEISKEVYQKLAYRDTTEGILAIAKTKSLLLSDLKLSENPLILVAESLEKPGNIGAILRTADAANLDAVIIANPKSDLYNPNVVRSSVGCLFTNNIATGKTSEIIAFLKEKNIRFYCATLQNSTSYHTQNYTLPTALVVGTEATGLSQEWRDAATKNIIIPMQGQIDSMNVSVAAAILIFEAKRQRGF